MRAATATATATEEEEEAAERGVDGAFLIAAAAVKLAVELAGLSARRQAASFSLAGTPTPAVAAASVAFLRLAAVSLNSRNSVSDLVDSDLNAAALQQQHKPSSVLSCKEAIASHSLLRSLNALAAVLTSCSEWCATC